MCFKICDKYPHWVAGPGICILIGLVIFIGVWFTPEHPGRFIPETHPDNTPKGCDTNLRNSYPHLCDPTPIPTSMPNPMPTFIPTPTFIPRFRFIAKNIIYANR